MPRGVLGEALWQLLGGGGDHGDLGDLHPGAAAATSSGACLGLGRGRAARPPRAATAFPGEAAEGRPIEEEWSNLSGLPEVSELSPAQEYFSKDIANSVEGSHFKPTFGCKCGQWGPAPAHPEIDFKPGWLDMHPDFESRLKTIHVHMEDLVNGKVHWDASYNLQKFRAPGGPLRLSETIPHEPGSGTQLRFRTFCPPAGGPPHQYKLKVTAYDQKDEPIDYMQDKESMYQASLAGQRRRRRSAETRDAAAGVAQVDAEAERTLQNNRSMMAGAQEAEQKLLSDPNVPMAVKAQSQKDMNKAMLAEQAAENEVRQSEQRIAQAAATR